MNYDDEDKPVELVISRNKLREAAFTRQLLQYARADSELTIKLVNMDLHGLISLVGILERLPNLKILDLSGNTLSREDFMEFMQTFHHKGLTEIIFRDNHMECRDETGWKDFNQKFSDFPNLPKLSRIDISGNAIHNHNDCLVYDMKKCDRELYQETFGALLEITKFSLREVLEAQWRGIFRHKNGDLKLQLSCGGEICEFDLDEDDCRYFDAVKASYEAVDSADVFPMLQMAIPFMCAADQGIHENRRYIDLSDDEKEKVKKLAFDYHPHAPLTSLLRRDPLYFSEGTHICQSLLYEVPLTRRQGYVYFLTRKDGQHAEIAFECLTPEGQRVFERAHLIVVDRKIKIEYKRRSLLEHRSKILEKYRVAKFNATYEQCKALWEAIDEEERTGLKYGKYSSSLSSSCSKEEAEARYVVNCVRWVVDKIKDHLNVNLYSYADPKSHIPAPTIGNILAQAKYRPGNLQTLLSSDEVKIIIEKNHPVFSLNNPRSGASVVPGRLGMFHSNIPPAKMERTPKVKQLPRLLETTEANSHTKQ